MERVHVVVAVGCTPVLLVFDNRDAAIKCKEAFESDYEKVYIYFDQDVLEDYAKYACPRCGSTTFKMSWTEPSWIIVDYDAEGDRFSTVNQSSPGDETPDDVEIECDSCGTGIDLDHGGDLEERIWNYV